MKYDLRAVTALIQSLKLIQKTYNFYSHLFLFYRQYLEESCPEQILTGQGRCAEEQQQAELCVPHDGPNSLPCSRWVLRWDWRLHLSSTLLYQAAVLWKGTGRLTERFDRTKSNPPFCVEGQKAKGLKDTGWSRPYKTQSNTDDDSTQSVSRFISLISQILDFILSFEFLVWLVGTHYR